MEKKKKKKKKRKERKEIEKESATKLETRDESNSFGESKKGWSTRVKRL